MSDPREIDRSEPMIGNTGYLIQLVTYEIDSPLGLYPMVAVEPYDPERLVDDAHNPNEGRVGERGET